MSTIAVPCLTAMHEGMSFIVPVIISIRYRPDLEFVGYNTGLMLSLLHSDVV